MTEVGYQLVWMGWAVHPIVGASAYVIFILLQKIQKMVKCIFWYRLTWVVLDKVQRAVKWLCVYPAVTSTAGMARLSTPAVSRVAFDDCLNGIILQVTCLSLGSTNNVKALKEHCYAFA